MSLHGIKIPVLMYHKVGALLPDGNIDRFISVSPQNFDKHMRLMRKLRYSTVTFESAAKQLAAGKPLTEKQFVVTFDDGYECVGEHAAPTLHTLGFCATVFVVSSATGLQNSWDYANNKPVLPLMGWDRLLELQAEGWELAGHTSTHPHLDRVTDEVALEDIVAGKQEAEARIGRPQTTFCYPYGGYATRTPELVKQAGYMAACTTKSGIADSSKNPMLLPRVKIAYGDGAAGLIYRLIIRPRMPSMRRP